MAFALLIFQGTNSIIGAGFGMILFGIMQGANATVPIAFWSEIYGTKYIGAIKALAVGVMVFGSAIGPAISGYYIDHGINFPDQMPAITISVVVTTVLACFGIARFSYSK